MHKPCQMDLDFYTLVRLSDYLKVCLLIQGPISGSEHRDECGLGKVGFKASMHIKAL